MLPTLQIGPLALPTAQLLVMIGFWLALELTEKHAVLFGVDAGAVFNGAVFGLVIGLVGARLGYAAQFPAAFVTSPISLLVLRPELLNPTIGVLVGLIACMVYFLIRRQPLWPIWDVFTTGFAVFAVALPLANLAAGDAYGTPSHLPWAVWLWGAARHPAQVYEMFAALGVAALVWPGGRVAGAALRRPGLRFWTFLGLSAAGWVLLEPFRAESMLLWQAFRLPQVIAWVLLAVSLWQLGRRLGSDAPHERKNERQSDA